ncbi:MAG: hypothetical protein JWN30_2291 [Bacilli bacterium]|nr:hypothetical protein [Bacilli bacterium]
MKHAGYLRSLRHEVASPIAYYLQFDNGEVPLNSWIGNQVVIDFANQRSCIVCNRTVKKLYNNGYCYPCFSTLAECDLCIVKPHECHYDQGTCRDNEFAHTHCMIPHLVYLAVSSGVKVGLTRKNRELIRWVDQGAIRAVPIAETPTRKIAGELEMAIAQFLPDKTDWRKMLRGDIGEVDLLSIRRTLRDRLPEQFHGYLLENEQIREFLYPLDQEPPKLKSMSLDATPSISGVLLGVKGQYLILDCGVLNMKKHSGYRVILEFGQPVELEIG